MTTWFIRSVRSPLSLFRMLYSASLSHTLNVLNTHQLDTLRMIFMNESVNDGARTHTCTYAYEIDCLFVCTIASAPCFCCDGFDDAQFHVD